MAQLDNIDSLIENIVVASPFIKLCSTIPFFAHGFVCFVMIEGEIGR